MSNIFTLTLNSAIEKVVYVNGDNYSDRDEEYYLTGKAVNTGLLLSNIGIPCEMNIVCGDDTRSSYTNLQNEYRTVNVYSVPGKTRINQTIVYPNGKEEKVPSKGYKLSEVQLEQLRYNLINKVRSGDILLIAGSLPDGMSNKWYSEIIHSANNKGVKVFFDAANETLLEGINSSPFYIKPNEEEVIGLIGRKKIKDLPYELSQISSNYSIENVIVTLGGKGALGYNWSSNQTVFVSTNEIFPTKVMTTGCGDSFNAGFIYGTIHGEGFINSMMYGVAFGGANIYSGFPEKIQLSVINDRMKYISYKII